MTFQRILEICIYELIDLIPNVILAFIPFQKNMRFSRSFNNILIFMVYLLLVLIRGLGLMYPALSGILSVSMIIIYLCFYKLCFKATIRRLLFVLLIVLNYGSFIAIIFSHIIYHRLSFINSHPYSFLSSATLGIVLIPTYPIMCIMMYKKIKPLLLYKENEKAWKSLWMIPAISCLSYYYSLYANGGIIAFSSTMSNVIFACALTAGNLFVTYIIAHLVGDSNYALQLKSDNYKLTMKSLQYEHLQQRIEETKRARHDMRQTLAVVQSYVQDNDRDGLQEYINKYIDTLPDESPIVYCENYALNALIVYYADLAKRKNITFKANIEYFSEYYLDDSDAVILFGNILENAIEASSKVNSTDSFINLSIKCIKHSLVATIENSYTNTIKKSGNRFLSSKGNRFGIGTSSISQIVKKYKGSVQFIHDEHAFYVLMIIYPNT